MIRALRLLVLSASCSVTFSLAAWSAEQGNIQAGRKYAERVCGECHSISPGTPPKKMPPTKVAPSFKSIAEAPTTSVFSLNAFLSTPHRDMPNLILSPRDRENVIAYIWGLKNRDQ